MKYHWKSVSYRISDTHWPDIRVMENQGWEVFQITRVSGIQSEVIYRKPERWIHCNNCKEDYECECIECDCPVNLVDDLIIHPKCQHGECSACAAHSDMACIPELE